MKRQWNLGPVGVVWSPRFIVKLKFVAIIAWTLRLEGPLPIPWPERAFPP